MINFSKIDENLNEQLNKSLNDTKKFNVNLLVKESARVGVFASKFTRQAIDELSNQDWVLGIKGQSESN